MWQTINQVFTVFWVLHLVVLQVITQVQAWVALRVPLIMWYPQFLLGHLHRQDLEQGLYQRSPVGSNTMGIPPHQIIQPSITTIATMGMDMVQLHRLRQCPRQRTKPCLRLWVMRSLVLVVPSTQHHRASQWSSIMPLTMSTKLR